LRFSSFRPYNIIVDDSFVIGILLALVIIIGAVVFYAAVRNT